MKDLSGFDPNTVGILTHNIFGLPFSEQDSRLILLPVPWEVTTSYSGGTAHGPQAILASSYQVDLYDPEFVDGWKQGFHMRSLDQDLWDKNDQLKPIAQEVIDHLSQGKPAQGAIKEKIERIHQGSRELNQWVYAQSKEILDSGKSIGLVGGDHSTPYGLIQALAERHPSFGILQIDAHADLRQAYEGFQYSHASIMYNVLESFPQVSKLVQLGVRDYCDEEIVMIRQNPDRISTFFDADIKEQTYEGMSWRQICDQIVDELPDKVYISFDVDGLDPKLCPHTGTPVPGGLEMAQVFYLFKKMRQAGKTWIGFDLNEVSPGMGQHESIDSQVGARLLYKLCHYGLNL